MSSPIPALGARLLYRGTQGVHGLRAAVVTADTQSLDPRGVASAEVPARSTRPRRTRPGGTPPDS